MEEDVRRGGGGGGSAGEAVEGGGWLGVGHLWEGGVMGQLRGLRLGKK